MKTLIVVDHPDRWPLDVPGVEVIDASGYLSERSRSGGRGTRVFNLCRTYRYQSVGYYVSLLATARGHRPFPSLGTIQDMRSPYILRSASEELESLIERLLKPLQSDTFVLSMYFGRNPAQRYERLCRHLFRLFDAPLLRGEFVRERKWRLQRVGPIATSEIPENHWDFVLESAEAFFAKRRFSVPKRREARYDIAILCDPEEALPPSDERALGRFEKAAREIGLEPYRIDKEDYGHLAEYDALFIRETTAVNNHTFRFARRAVAEGLVVMDDPESIVRCANKVYLAELLAKNGIPSPRTVIVNKDAVEGLAGSLSWPCVVKQPDSAFSQGVFKADSPEDFRKVAQQLLDRSELIIAQEFLPTSYDWRIGVLDGQPLYACRYHMTQRHWQIARRGKDGKTRFGAVDCVAREDTPARVIDTAVRAARLIGDGLYGVDLKQVGNRCYVIEVNDNPNIDAGNEDAVLGKELYLRIMRVFLKRIERRRNGGGG